MSCSTASRSRFIMEPSNSQQTPRQSSFVLSSDDDVVSSLASTAGFSRDEEAAALDGHFRGQFAFGLATTHRTVVWDVLDEHGEGDEVGHEAFLELQQQQEKQGQEAEVRSRSTLTMTVRRVDPPQECDDGSGLRAESSERMSAPKDSYFPSSSNLPVYDPFDWRLRDNDDHGTNSQALHLIRMSAILTSDDGEDDAWLELAEVSSSFLGTPPEEDEETINPSDVEEPSQTSTTITTVFSEKDGEVPSTQSRRDDGMEDRDNRIRKQLLDLEELVVKRSTDEGSDDGIETNLEKYVKLNRMHEKLVDVKEGARVIEIEWKDSRSCISSMTNDTPTEFQHVKLPLFQGHRRDKVSTGNTETANAAESTSKNDAKGNSGELQSALSEPTRRFFTRYPALAQKLDKKVHSITQSSPATKDPDCAPIPMEKLRALACLQRSARTQVSEKHSAEPATANKPFIDKESETAAENGSLMFTRGFVSPQNTNLGPPISFVDSDGDRRHDPLYYLQRYQNPKKSKKSNKTQNESPLEPIRRALVSNATTAAERSKSKENFLDSGSEPSDPRWCNKNQPLVESTKRIFSSTVKAASGSNKKTIQKDAVIKVYPQLSRFSSPLRQAPSTDESSSPAGTAQKISSATPPSQCHRPLFAPVLFPATLSVPAPAKPPSTSPVVAPIIDEVETHEKPMVLSRKSLSNRGRPPISHRNINLGEDQKTLYQSKLQERPDLCVNESREEPKEVFYSDEITVQREMDETLTDATREGLDERQVIDQLGLHRSNDFGTNCTEGKQTQSSFECLATTKSATPLKRQNLDAACISSTEDPTRCLTPTRSNKACTPKLKGKTETTGKDANCEDDQVNTSPGLIHMVSSSASSEESALHTTAKIGQNDSCSSPSHSHAKTGRNESCDSRAHGDNCPAPTCESPIDKVRRALSPRRCESATRPDSNIEKRGEGRLFKESPMNQVRRVMSPTRQKKTEEETLEGSTVMSPLYKESPVEQVRRVMSPPRRRTGSESEKERDQISNREQGNKSSDNQNRGSESSETLHDNKRDDSMSPEPSSEGNAVAAKASLDMSQEPKTTKNEQLDQQVGSDPQQKSMPPSDLLLGTKAPGPEGVLSTRVLLRYSAMNLRLHRIIEPPKDHLVRSDPSSDRNETKKNENQDEAQKYCVPKKEDGGRSPEKTTIDSVTSEPMREPVAVVLQGKKQEGVPCEQPELSLKEVMTEQVENTDETRQDETAQQEQRDTIQENRDHPDGTDLDISRTLPVTEKNELSVVDTFRSVDTTPASIPPLTPSPSETLVASTCQPLRKGWEKQTKFTPRTEPAPISIFASNLIDNDACSHKHRDWKNIQSQRPMVVFGGSVSVLDDSPPSPPETPLPPKTILTYEERKQYRSVVPVRCFLPSPSEFVMEYDNFTFPSSEIVEKYAIMYARATSLTPPPPPDKNSDDSRTRRSSPSTISSFTRFMV